MSIPPNSWDAAQGADFNARFGRMNVNAQPFVPNVGAQPFVPGVYPQYGYPVHGPPQMHPATVYGHHPPPGMHVGMHQVMPPRGQYMMPQVASRQQQQGMGPPKPIHVSALESEQISQATAQQTAAVHQQLFGEHPHLMQVPQALDDPSSQQGLAGKQHSQTSPQTSRGQSGVPVAGRAEKRSPPKVDLPLSSSSSDSGRLSQDNPVDSWEDIADSGVTDETENIKDTSPPQQQKVSSSKSVKSTDSERVTRKNPSPNLSEKSSKGKSSTEGEGRKVVHVAAPPPKKEDDKENVNIVFIGHVDAGKSTIGGHVMYLTGQVDKRTLEKYEREAKEKNRETWYLSWALDTNQEERDKGKTVEVGRAAFETDKKRFTILDAPGHAGFVPNMISGTAQADIGVLVISARRGEFETGFERRGQTREHAMLAKTAGVKHLVVLINKMDDPTVSWSEERYEECKTKLTPFLKKVGFNPKTDIFYIPVSGLTGINLKDPAPKDICDWFNGPAFIPYLENLPSLSREDAGPFRMPIADKYKDMGTVVLGKVESGGVMKGSSLLLMPNRVSVEVLSVTRVEEEVSAAYSGDNIKLKLKGIEEEVTYLEMPQDVYTEASMFKQMFEHARPGQARMDISPGFVLCDPSSPCHVGQEFDAQIVILEHKSIICAGYSAVLHIHSVVEEVQITQLIALVDRRTGKKTSQRPRFVKQDQVVIARLQTAGIICLESFQEFPQMARFTLRDEGKTIAIGKVLKLVE